MLNRFYESDPAVFVMGPCRLCNLLIGEVNFGGGMEPFPPDPYDRVSKRCVREKWGRAE